MSAIDRLLATAKKEIGYLEKATNSQLDSKTANAGYNNYTKYARDLDNLGVYNGKKNGYAWCDMFVDWCFVQTFGLEMALKMTGQPKGGYGAGCTCSANYYKAMGRFYTNPQPGDQIFFKNGNEMSHTGIVTRVANGYVYTIEGNTSSAAGVVANGGAVRDKSYSLGYSRIGGYGRPKWDLVENIAPPEIKTVNYKGKVTASSLNCRTSGSLSADIVKSYNNGEIVNISKECEGWGYTGEGWVSLDYITKVVEQPKPAPAPVQQENTPKHEEEKAMTQEKFNQMMNVYLAELASKPATWEASAMKWVEDRDIMIGDEKGQMKPKSFVTRGELATVVRRVIEGLDK